MSDSDVTLVSTGTANLASVMAAFERIGARAVIAPGPEAVRTARRVVLPGVGAFAAAMTVLRGNGMAEVLVERLDRGDATLMICLGLQLLAEGSEESPDVAGLGVIPATVRRLPAGVRLPQLGWNQVVPASPQRFVREGYAYYANSFCLYQADPSWKVAWTDHGGAFVASLERERQLACQFHPELSATWGQELLTRWYQGC